MPQPFSFPIWLHPCNLVLFGRCINTFILLRHPSSSSPLPCPSAAASPLMLPRGSRGTRYKTSPLYVHVVLLPAYSPVSSTLDWSRPLVAAMFQPHPHPYPARLCPHQGTCPKPTSLAAHSSAELTGSTGDSPVNGPASATYNDHAYWPGGEDRGSTRESKGCNSDSILRPSLVLDGELRYDITETADSAAARRLC